MPRAIVFIACALLTCVTGIAQGRQANDGDVLHLLAITPSAQSLDYVANKRQFQLHTLLTEQRHPQTMDLSRRIASDTTAGLRELFAVDRDVTRTMDAVAADPARLRQLENASKAMQDALRHGHRVYFYGTGSTGRLAETLESSLWRPFWERAAKTPSWRKIDKALPGIGDHVRGEITGGDRALIASLEGFEDLQLIGRLQLQDNGIRRDDVVFAVTEGGETSAVIGTAKAGAELNGGRPGKTWFVYNNPDTVLLPFTRSREVIEASGITKVNLATGPQAITGSTRMQATTTSLYALGVVMEDAIHHLLAPVLSKTELRALGFDGRATIAARLREFSTLQHTVAATAPRLAAWTDRESATYASGHHTTYLAGHALMPVFVDVTERAPTFRLAPLDRVDAKERRSWIQVWAPVDDADSAWRLLLHRFFHGLDPALYAQPFATQIDDAWLKAAAARSLANAGAEQQTLYDLSFSPRNLQAVGPAQGDHGAMILLGAETPDTSSMRWLRTFTTNGASIDIIHVGDAPLLQRTVAALRAGSPRPALLDVVLPIRHDPLELDRIIALKMLLNAHSTAIMAKLGRVVGNTMTAVQPGNLKLIGRATFLIQSHVNTVLASGKWKQAHGATPPLTYAQANAVLFDVIEQRGKNPALASSPEVELAIVRILEGLRLQRAFSLDEAAALLRSRRLDAYLGGYDG
ncbi:hypothetical protein [Solilutibacter silvestris]|uniref:SIS domain-containing protein n=1 Tax=Solilutibacter silvestris TaxID=1645665 RepID=A0A2K1PYH7_9GAMM|nr:hypothetical protein [Lysobacter silvestris]PNS07840.1 hypothetical protein Lysil_2016 [Lysobacter silvestris]